MLNKCKFQPTSNADKVKDKELLKYLHHSLELLGNLQFK